MPVYEYVCQKNGHAFEVVQSMSDTPITKCEVCGGKVERVLFAPAIHFKGSGFHNTDYGTRKRPKDAGSDSSKGGEGGKAEGGKAEGAKPESSSTGASGGTGGGGSAKEATPKDRAKRGVGP